jgi:hypothetical protein
MVDTRDSLADGLTWRIVVHDSHEDDIVRVNFTGLNELPGQIEPYCIDHARQISFRLEQPSFTYLHQHGQDRLFSLCVGTRAYINRSIRHTRPIPASFRIAGNYPNPFSSRTNIRYTIPLVHAGAAPGLAVFAGIYDTRGSLIATLIDGRVEPGYYAVAWDGRGDDGAETAAGTYLCRFNAGGIFIKTMKMLKVR